MSGSVSFEERMSGWIAFGEPSFNQAAVKGRKLEQSFTQHLVVDIEDVGRFIDDPQHEARLSGTVRCPALGEELRLARAWLNLFIEHGSAHHRRMLYRLFVVDRDGRAFTVSGFKDLQHGPYVDGWHDTSRLLVRVLEGHLHQDEEPNGDEATIATGILYLTVSDFARLYASMLRRGQLPGAPAAAKFAGFFAGQIAKYYVRDFLRPDDVNDADFPSPTSLDPRWQGHEPEEWHRLPVAGGLERRIVGFRTEDGREGTLHNIRTADRSRESPLGPVMLSHGCSVRANMFYGAPTRQTIVRALVEEGYDVWLENWRGSIDLPPSTWTLDEAAVYDHPAAVREILARTGSPTLKAVVHCQGSTSFVMAAVAGLLPEVTHIVSNAVSLHVSVTPLSRLRLRTLLPATTPLLKGVDPQWTVRPPASINAGIATLAWLQGGHCNSRVCRAANWFYGVGGEVLWLHRNLDEATHTWNDREWGFCPMTFFKQMRKCAEQGHLVPTGVHPELPQDLLAAPPQTTARFTLIAGRDNICFLPESQQRTFDYLERIDPGRHELHLIRGYSHLDIFIGKDADRDVYPLILEGLS